MPTETITAIETLAGDVRVGDRVPVDPQGWGFGPADLSAPYALLVDLPDSGPTVCAAVTVTAIERRRGGYLWLSTDHGEPIVILADEDEHESIDILPRP